MPTCTSSFKSIHYTHYATSMSRCRQRREGGGGEEVSAWCHRVAAADLCCLSVQAAADYMRARSRHESVSLLLQMLQMRRLATGRSSVPCPPTPETPLSCWLGSASARNLHRRLRGARGDSDDIAISSWTMAQYRDPKTVHDSSPNFNIYTTAVPLKVHNKEADRTAYIVLQDTRNHGPENWTDMQQSQTKQNSWE